MHGYLIRHGEIESGPYEMVRLREMWAAGKIGGSTKFRRTDHNYWIDAEDILMDLEFQAPADDPEIKAALAQAETSVPPRTAIVDEATIHTSSPMSPQKSYRVHYSNEPSVSRVLQCATPLDAAKDFALQVPNRGADCNVTVSEVGSESAVHEYRRESGLWSARQVIASNSAPQKTDVVQDGGGWLNTKQKTAVVVGLVAFLLSLLNIPMDFSAEINGEELSAYTNAKFVPFWRIEKEKRWQKFAVKTIGVFSDALKEGRLDSNIETSAEVNLPKLLIIWVIITVGTVGAVVLLATSRPR